MAFTIILGASSQRRVYVLVVITTMPTYITSAVIIVYMCCLCLGQLKTESKVMIQSYDSASEKRHFIVELSMPV